MQTTWDISTGSSGQSPDYQDGLYDGMEQATSVSVYSSDRSTIASGDMGDSWLEYPFENLIIGQLLHEGDFTCVLKSEGEGINGVDEPQVVCVKMLKGGRMFSVWFCNSWPCKTGIWIWNRRRMQHTLWCRQAHCRYMYTQIPLIRFPLNPAKKLLGTNVCCMMNTVQLG